MANSASYERPEEDVTDSMRALGKEVQLTTFKTNQKGSTLQEGLQQEIRKLGIACVGTSNFWDKIVYIRHCFQDKPSISDSNCIIGVETLEKDVLWDKQQGSVVDMNRNDVTSVTQCESETDQERCQTSSQDLKESEFLCNRNQIPLQLHLSIVGQRMPDTLAKLYLTRRDSKVGIIGAVVFCSANHTTLQSAIEWKNVVQEAVQLHKNLPVVLIIENINSTVKWMGDGHFVEDEESMNEYCQKAGLTSWMEMNESDWNLGERNVFGQAVNVILRHELCSNVK